MRTYEDLLWLRKLCEDGSSPEELASNLERIAYVTPRQLYPRLLETVIPLEDDRIRGRVIATIAQRFHKPEDWGHALAVLRRLEPGPRQLQVLRELVEHLPDSLGGELLGMAGALPQELRAEALVLMLPYMSEPLRPRLLEALLHTKDVHACRRMLAVCASTWRDLPEKWRQLLAMFQRLGPCPEQVQLLKELAAHLPHTILLQEVPGLLDSLPEELGAQARPLLAPYFTAAAAERESAQQRELAVTWMRFAGELTQERLQAALEAVRSIQRPSWRIAVCETLLKRLPPEAREELAREALVAVHQGETDAERQFALERIARFLPWQVRLEAFLVMPGTSRFDSLVPTLLHELSTEQLRDLVHHLRNAAPPARAWGLALIAPRLPEAERPELLRTVLEVVRYSQSFARMGDLFSSIANRIPDQLVPFALETASMIREPRERLPHLLALLARLPPEERIPWLKLARNDASSLGNEDLLIQLLCELASLVPESEEALESLLSTLSRTPMLRQQIKWLLGYADERVLDALRERFPLKFAEAKARPGEGTFSASPGDAGEDYALDTTLGPEGSPRPSGLGNRAFGYPRNRPQERYGPLNAPRQESLPFSEGVVLASRRTPPRAEVLRTGFDALQRLAPATEPVLLGTSAPSEASAGDEFTARFVACVERLERELLARLEHVAPEATTANLGFRRCQWQLGTRVRVRLTSHHLHVSPDEQEFVWDAAQCVLDFGVRVPARAQLRKTALHFEMFIEGTCVAVLRQDLVIVRRRKAPVRRRHHLGRAPRTAFASYASEDRPAVLHRVAALSISAGLDVFTDCLSLKAGEQWKKVLKGEIQQRDVFLLFWSRHARVSRWVEWEWKTALRLKRLAGIQPHPLEPPHQAPPPKELERLHFGDAHMLAAATLPFAHPRRS